VLAPEAPEAPAAPAPDTVTEAVVHVAAPVKPKVVRKAKVVQTAAPDAPAEPKGTRKKPATAVEPAPQVAAPDAPAKPKAPRTKKPAADAEVSS
jgi:hypothetical protein